VTASQVAISLAYLLAAVLFIVGLKQLSSPKGARNGNFIAAIGMVVALGATVPLLHFTQAGLVITAIGILIGTIVGTVGARMVRMTAIPQMVALFNGVGGGAAASWRWRSSCDSVPTRRWRVFPSVFSIVISSVSFAGSAIAFASSGAMTDAVTYPREVLTHSSRRRRLRVAVLAIASIPFVPAAGAGPVLRVACAAHSAPTCPW
jgi:NAD(P) transhydrogenase subunit beta